MKNYAESPKFPFTEIGGIPVPRLILGHLPFIGESYQGLERNLDFVKRFSNIENTVNIMSKVVNKYGITVAGAIPATEGKMATLLLEAIRETMKRTSIEVALIPCLKIPLAIGKQPLDDYRRWVTYYHIEKKIGKEILKHYIEDPVLLCRKGWREKFPYALAHANPYTKTDLKNLRVDHDKIEQDILSLEGYRILFVELGSETDFLAMTDKLDLLSDLVDRLRNDFGYPVLLASHHAGLTIPILEKNRINSIGYVTPINKLGVMMFPTQKIVLKAIREAKKPIIAIKPLAGGRIPPKTAFEYIYGDLGIKTCMVGLGLDSEVDEDIPAALEKI